MKRGTHFVGDGLGRRDVYVNGNRIHGVIFADTERGIVRYHPKPARLHKLRRDEVYTRTLKGRVDVHFCGEK